MCFNTSRMSLAGSTGVFYYLPIFFGWINWCALIPLACLWLDQLVCFNTSRLSLAGSTGVFKYLSLVFSRINGCVLLPLACL